MSPKSPKNTRLSKKKPVPVVKRRLRIPLPRVSKSWIPNAFTLTSLFLGFSSILASIQSVKEIIYIGQPGHPDASPERYLAYAGILIVSGCILDMMDGVLARALQVSSEFGKHLDSMADLVTFGIAPGVLFYTVLLFAGHSFPSVGVVISVAHFIPDAVVNNLFLLKVLAFLFPTCAVIRLARFNNAPSTPYFTGIPSTFAGGAVAVFLTFNVSIPPVQGFLIKMGVGEIPVFTAIYDACYGVFKNFLFLLISYLILAFGMVSTIRFYKVRYYLKRMSRRGRVLFLIGFAASGLLFFQYALLLFALYYFIHSTYKHFYFKKYPEKADY